MTNKPILKVGFTDYWETVDEFWVDILSRKYEIVRDDVDPDYLFFADETFGTHNQSFTRRIDLNADPNVNRNRPVRIFFTGENRRPQNYRCNYAITFDHDDSNTQYRLPLYVIDNWLMTTKLGMPDANSISTERYATDRTAKTKFCAFISGNPGCQKRNEFYQLLSSYKKVDSPGPLFNNMEPLPRGFEAAKNKDDFLKPYKFNMCFENGSYPGYCTEKLFHAFYSKTVPIYWGSPTAALDFNPKAFLNWHDYQDDQALLDAVIELDNDPIKYYDMFMQPMFPNGKQPGCWDMDRFLRWFDRNVYKGVLKQ